MKYEFKSDRSVEEVKRFFKQYSKADGFGSVMSNSNPDQLFLRQKQSQFELFLGSGKRITPSFVCKIESVSGSTLIAGDLKYDRAVYFVMGAMMIFGSYIMGIVDDLHLRILPFFFIVGSGICLLRMKFGKQKDKNRLLSQVAEMIDIMNNSSAHSTAVFGSSE